MRKPDYFGLEPERVEKKNKSGGEYVRTLKKMTAAAGSTVKNAALSALKHVKTSAAHRRETKRMRLDTAYYNPSESMSVSSVIVGTALRGLTVFMGIFGLLMFWCDAMDIVHLAYHKGVFYVEPAYVALCSFIAAVLAVATSYNRVTAAAVPTLSVGAAAAFIAVKYGNPALFIWQSICRFVNYCVGEMVEIGFSSVARFRLPDSYSFNINELLNGSVALAAALLGVFFYFTLVKKVRLVPNAVLISAVYIFIFSYNLTQKNTGFALSLVFVCGAVALYIYDSRFLGGMEKRAAAKKARAEKREARKKTKASAKADRANLRRRAAAVYNAALKAQAGPDKARKAKKALLARAAAVKKAEKKRLKKEKKLRREEGKAERRRIGAEKRKVRKNAGADEKEALKKEASAMRQSRKKDKRIKQRNDLYRRAAGGFAAAAAMAAAGLAVWLPAAALKTEFPVIESIDEQVSYVRRYVTTMLRGDDVDLNGKLYSEDYLISHTLSFDDVTPQGNTVFHVDAGDGRNVYLRSWVGVNYDDSVSTWTSFSPSQVVAMTDEFGKDFSSDDITSAFMSSVYPGTAAEVKAHEKKTFAKYGFVYEHVGVIRKSGASRVVFVPSVVDTDFGIMKYASLDKTAYPYSKYFDGVYSTRFFDVNEGYSTMSYIPAMNTPGVGDEIDKSLKYYDYTVSAIRSVENGEDATSVGDALTQRLAAEEVGYTGDSLFDRYLAMSDGDKAEFLSSVELEEKYRQYVYSTYLTSSGSAEVAALADEISKSVVSDGSNAVLTTDDTELTLHDRVMRVMNWLDGNYTYTLTPKGGDDTAGSAPMGETSEGGISEDETSGTEAVVEEDSVGMAGIAEKFLFETKEGYCTHFATSAVLLLREMGIPARYAEGYIATGFTKDFTARSSGFSADVEDGAAHAWVEVYFPGRGWITYEATPKYMPDMYDYDEGSAGEYQPEAYVPPKRDPVHEEVPEDYDPEDGGVPAFIIWSIAAAIAAAIIVAAVIIAVRRIIKKADKAVYERHVILTDAMSKEAYIAGKVPDDAAKRINDWMFAALAVAGCTPAKGELPSDFARRIDAVMGSFSHVSCVQVMEHVQSEEFGHGLNQSALAELAEYTLDLISVVYAGLSFYRRIYYRYIKRVI